MKVQIGTGGSSSQAATLQDISFRSCGAGAEFVTNKDHPGGTDTDQFTVVRITADREQSKDGSRRVMIQVKVKFPMTQVNTNGTTVITTPEVQAHTVIRVPSAVAKAVEGAMTVISDGGVTRTPTDQAVAAVVQALAYLSTIVTNQPANYTAIRSSLFSGPVFYGLIGSCPMDFVDGDYGTSRVLPPPART